MGMARGVRGDRGAGGAGGSSVVTLATSYTEHGAALRAFLAGSTRDAAAAEDLLHETYLRLLIEIAAGRVPRYPRAWLFRVAANLATSRARRQGVASRHAGELVRTEHAPSPEQQLLEREAASDVSEHLRGMPEHARHAFLLTAAGFSGAEVARHIGRSELATRSLLCRYRSRLRATLPAA